MEMFILRCDSIADWCIHQILCVFN
uniref:Uncharacterized protein n=1 Tax=Arundo donax TaxID=35708 RepID=A0A0A9A9N6_ARUDO